MPAIDPKELARLIAEHLRESKDVCPLSLTKAGAAGANAVAKYGSIGMAAAVTILVGVCLAKLFGPF